LAAEEVTFTIVGAAANAGLPRRFEMKIVATIKKMERFRVYLFAAMVPSYFL
jgi:hypothetical protein